MSESTLLGQSLTQREREKTFKEELFLEIKTEIIVTRGQVKGYAPIKHERSGAVLLKTSQAEKSLCKKHLIAVIASTGCAAKDGFF